jgi:hypothetical protein
MKTYEITVWLEVQIFFFFKLIIPEIQHLIVGENRQHNIQKKCTIGESYNARNLKGTTFYCEASTEEYNAPMTLDFFDKHYYF